VDHLRALRITVCNVSLGRHVQAILRSDFQHVFESREFYGRNLKRIAEQFNEGGGEVGSSKMPSPKV
jgi:hypothetical protein